MNNLNEIDSGRIENYEPFSKKENFINTILPIEVLEKIFSFLREQDFMPVHLVNRFWKKAVIHMKHKEFCHVKQLATFLETNREKEFRIQQQNNYFIDKDSGIVKSLHLKQFKISIYYYKQAIVNGLKILDEKQLENLKDLSRNKPFFLQAVFDLAKIEREIDKADDVECFYHR